MSCGPCERRRAAMKKYAKLAYERAARLLARGGKKPAKEKTK